MPAKIQTANNLYLASLCLRIGLAVVFAYAAIDALRHPYDWTYFIPHGLNQVVPAMTTLRFAAVAQLAIAAVLLSGRWLRWAAAASALMLSAIIILNMQSYSITFRDVGLLAAAVALFLLASPRQR